MILDRRDLCAIERGERTVPGDHDPIWRCTITALPGRPAFCRFSAGRVDRGVFRRTARATRSDDRRTPPTPPEPTADRFSGSAAPASAALAVDVRPSTSQMTRYHDSLRV
jgi:hypothetical protein